MAEKVVRAGILVTGTEVLTARIVDRNGPWISERLSELGVEVASIVIVADRPDDLESALRSMLADGFELIITSGGLGPTADDLTAEVVAKVAGLEMRLDPAMEEKIAEILRGLSVRIRLDPKAVMDANRKQAMVPEGAIPLDPIGTAPGLVVPVDGGVIVVLPGPPRELQPMWKRAIETGPATGLLQKATPLSFYTLRIFGTPESELAMSLRSIEDEGVDLDRVEITTCLRKGEIEVDVRWRDGEEEVATAVREGLRARHERFMFSEDGTTVDEIVARLLGNRMLATAESCSSGLLAARITLRPGASDYFAGGAVTYSNASKAEILGVDAGLIDERGAVSPEVAEAMARGALDRFGADTAIAITGIAGPGGGTEEKPIGYVCFHARLADDSSLARDLVIPGGREDIRERSALVAMHMLRVLLSGDKPPL